MEIKPTVDYDFEVGYLPIKLSILIATMPSRKQHLLELWKMLGANRIVMFPNVEIITDDRLDYNIGIKRNKLLLQAKGEYIVYIDDDDEIASNYVPLILQAIQSGADCIGISGIITTNGQDKRQWHISKEYGHWHTAPDGTYLRTPNHISPVKRELALQAGFPEIAFGEDAEYSRRLLPLLKTEVKIEQNIYHYKYVSQK